jgi:hypothetical protein
MSPETLNRVGAQAGPVAADEGILEYPAFYQHNMRVSPFVTRSVFVVVCLMLSGFAK